MIQCVNVITRYLFVVAELNKNMLYTRTNCMALKQKAADARLRIG